VTKTRSINAFNVYSRGEIPILIYLVHHESEQILPSDLGKACQISNARVANILNSLEEKGFISREIDLTDRRKIHVSITEAGKARAQKEKEKTLNALARILDEIGEEDTDEFIRLLGRFIEVGSASTGTE